MRKEIKKKKDYLKCWRKWKSVNEVSRGRSKTDWNMSTLLWHSWVDYFELCHFQSRDSLQFVSLYSFLHSCEFLRQPNGQMLVLKSKNGCTTRVCFSSDFVIASSSPTTSSLASSLSIGLLSNDLMIYWFFFLLRFSFSFCLSSYMVLSFLLIWSCLFFLYGIIFPSYMVLSRFLKESLLIFIDFYSSFTRLLFVTNFLRFFSFFIFPFLYISGQSSPSEVAHMLKCDIRVSEFEL